MHWLDSLFFRRGRLILGFLIFLIIVSAGVSSGIHPYLFIPLSLTLIALFILISFFLSKKFCKNQKYKKKKIQDGLVPSSRKKTLIQAMIISGILVVAYTFLMIAKIHYVFGIPLVWILKSLPDRALISLWYFSMLTLVLYYVIKWLKKRKISTS